MKRSLKALVLVAATATTADAQSNERIELLVSIVRDNDCRLTDADAQRLLPEYGFSKPEYQSITSILGARGWVVRGDFGVLTLSEEVCGTN